MLVRGKDFDDFARMLLRLFDKDGGELFLKALLAFAVEL
jgi:hypothetical protein